MNVHCNNNECFENLVTAKSMSVSQISYCMGGQCENFVNVKKSGDVESCRHLQ